MKKIASKLDKANQKEQKSPKKEHKNQRASGSHDQESL